MTSIHFQQGVRKANRKIERLQNKKSSIVARRLETLQSKAMKRYWQSLDCVEQPIKDFAYGYYIAMSYYLYRGIKFQENQEF